jgi:diguanylate cyclase (GGDEF)-like protein
VFAFDAVQGIPQPPGAMIEPRVLASAGAVLAAVLLGILYIYRGRAFIVYWIVSWMLLAGSLFLTSRGYASAVVGGVMLGLSQLLAAWSAGLVTLGAKAFPEAPLRWDTPIKIAAVTAVWFITIPLIAPLDVVFLSGTVLTAFLLGRASLRYADLFRRTHHAGTALVAAGTVLLTLSNLVAAAMIAQGPVSQVLLDRMLAANAVINIFIALGMHLLVFEDMTGELRAANRELAAANEEVRRLAITDALTGCYNRRFFDSIERREIQRHRRYGSPLTVMFVDVNGFKHLNDTLGHDTGDAVLRAIGAMLRRNVRTSDYVIRWGGDEFMLLLTCSLDQAHLKEAELKAAFAADPETAGLPKGVGLSLGSAQVSANAESLRDAARLADERMYQDKFSDKARIAR